jgi:hypothetical protein
MPYACDAKTVRGLAEKAVAQTATASSGTKRIFLVKLENVSARSLARLDTGQWERTRYGQVETNMEYLLDGGATFIPAFLVDASQD